MECAPLGPLHKPSELAMAKALDRAAVSPWCSVNSREGAERWITERIVEVPLSVADGSKLRSEHSIGITSRCSGVIVAWRRT